MGYFANGTEGGWYENFICGRCVHQDDENGCAVWAIHLIHNGEDDPVAQDILETLIPTDGVDNLLCNMWMPSMAGYEDLPEQYEELLKRRKEARK